jgi:hypothetical protein
MATRTEFEAEMKRANFTRAADIADEEGLGSEDLDAARDAAFKQSVGAWFNFRGAESLAREWGFDRGRVSRLCDELIADLVAREKKEGRQLLVFDVERMDHTLVTKLVATFRDRFR